MKVVLQRGYGCFTDGRFVSASANWTKLSTDGAYKRHVTMLDAAVTTLREGHLLRTSQACLSFKEIIIYNVSLLVLSVIILTYQT